MTTEKCREEFEKWAKENPMRSVWTWDLAKHKFGGMGDELALKIWCAAWEAAQNEMAIT